MSRRPLNESAGQPQLPVAFSDWQSSITLEKVIQDVDGFGLVYEHKVTLTFKGMIQPLSPKALMLKPENLRAFTWLQIHCFSGANLNDNDLIEYAGNRYKIMALLDYSLNGFIEYHAVADFHKPGAE